MKLDCEKVKGSELYEIIDYDNGKKQVCTGESVEEAWYLAAMNLESMINSAKEKLNT